MIEFTARRLNRILEQCRNRRILVLGDVMLDRYLWGQVSRISPEAPVPIISISDEDIRFGGAANVANNIIGLGGAPVLLGTVGDDQWGETFRRMLEERNLPSHGLICDPSRPTTLKTRIIGNNQHIARVDYEEAHPIDPAVQKQIMAFLQEQIDQVDGIILQDYNKGVLTPELVSSVIALARQHEKIVTVDPKFDNFFSFKGVTLFKPNKKETAEALAMRLVSEEDIRRAGALLLKRLEAQAVLITLGAQGMALFERDGQASFVKTYTRQVADVSGAGDTVIAVVTLMLAAGAEMREAVALANFAAGVVCEEVGAVPIEQEQLRSAVLARQ